MPYNADTLATILCGDAAPADHRLYLQLGDCLIRVRCNAHQLSAVLAEYFAHVVVAPVHKVDFEVLAIQRAQPQLDIEYRDWQREAGKRGRKDSHADFGDARLVHKVRTGMLFLQSDRHCIAAGDCLANDNQVINFINAQYMTWLQQRGWLICHAAALTRHDRALGIAGFSGGGKSTLMLHLLEQQDASFLTNDRLFIRRQGEKVYAAGVPKLPRINPGTIVHNPRLQPLIDPAARERLLALPQQQLWHLEDKYDVPIERLYGAGRIRHEAQLGAFLVLNWRHDTQQPMQLQQVDIRRRRDLLPALMKSPGPFLQHSDGSFHRDDMALNEDAYLAVLGDLPVYEASGGVDFAALAAAILEAWPT